MNSFAAEIEVGRRAAAYDDFVRAIERTIITVEAQHTTNGGDIINRYCLQCTANRVGCGGELVSYPCQAIKDIQPLRAVLQKHME